jgi:nucleoside-diphosphate-sugar epimerase
VRTFNTYGPYMRPDDGRVVSNFVVDALANRPLTIFGDGKHTRSFCYVDDQIAGYVAMLDSDVTGPVNVGNPNEMPVAELAELVLEMTGSTAGVEHRPLPPDDPAQRCPDITLAHDLLGWSPRVDMREGLSKTIAYFRTRSV